MDGSSKTVIIRRRDQQCLEGEPERRGWQKYYQVSLNTNYELYLRVEKIENAAEQHNENGVTIYSKNPTMRSYRKQKFMNSITSTVGVRQNAAKSRCFGACLRHCHSHCRCKCPRVYRSDHRLFTTLWA
jgi:hypothetical protein